MSSEVNSKLKALQRVYEISVNTRNFEITQLTNRNNYYMLFQGVLLAAVFSNQASKPLVEFLICLAGIGVSYNHVKVASGAKFWQEYWEFQASFIPLKINFLYTIKKPIPPRMGFFNDLSRSTPNI